MKIPGILTAVCLAASAHAQVQSVPVNVPVGLGGASAAGALPAPTLGSLPAAPAAPSLGPALLSPPSAFPAPRGADARGASPRRGATAQAGRDRPPGAGGWTEGRFDGADGGAPISYRSRGEGGRPRIFLGGMALARSFESYFRAAAPDGAQVVLFLRGLAPSPWAAAGSILDADARDLARMIVLAARERGAGGGDLVLHSYAAFVFQRMLQLPDAEAHAAAALLRGGRVVWVGATTHWKGSESLIGPQFELASRVARMQVAWLDSMDKMDEGMARMAEAMPWLRPQVAAWRIGWVAQRAAAIQLATEPTADMLESHLAGPWPADSEPVRRELAAGLKEEAGELGWREAALRRMTGALDLDFSEEDARRLVSLGIRLELVYGRDDQFIPWKAERAVLERLGIAAPQELPPAGTVLRDSTGRISVTIVAGDHYYPLKDPAGFAEAIQP